MKPSDSFIVDMTVPEKAWMQSMVLQDDKEDYEEKIEFIEYLASFSNPEAVKKIRHDRKSGNKMDDVQLVDTLKQISGRDAPVFQSKE